MKQFFLAIVISLLAFGSQSQTIFIKTGKIEFERKTNTHRLYFTGETDSWVEEFKKMIPQFRTDYFDLIFTEDKTLYKPGKEPEEQKTGFFERPAAENVVYKDLNQQSLISQKQVFETQFLVSDSVKTLTWKLESETRIIAGFECRKAVTRICDSVVVVAFYTDEIIPSSGPESFSGLPGMILGLAVPRLYTTWFATKIEVINDNDDKKIIPPAKGKKANGKEVIGQINEAIKNWGDKYLNSSIWFVTL